MGFPYTDVNSTYAAEGTGDLIDGSGLTVQKNLINVNSVASVADGMFDLARGPVGQASSSDPHFNAPVVFDGSQYDVRGLTSISVLMWVRITANSTEVFGWSVWNGSDAEGQAWVLSPNVILPGPTQGPRFHMYDGLADFNNIGVYARTSGADIPINDWHLIGGSWNAVTNVLSCFFGDGSDSSGDTVDFNTVSGFAAGFGYSANSDVAIGKFLHGGAAADVMEVDGLAYWKGRAFDEQDFLNHWNKGAGLLPSQYTGVPDMAFSAIRESIQLRSRSAEIDPTLLELVNVDLELAPDVESRLVDGRDNFVFTLYSIVDNTAATTGTFSLFLDLYERDGVTLLEAVELFSAQLPTSDNTVKIQFGLGLTAALTGTATIGTAIDSLKLIQLFKIRLVNDTPADAASLLDVRILIGD